MSGNPVPVPSSTAGAHRSHDDSSEIHKIEGDSSELIPTAGPSISQPPVSGSAVDVSSEAADKTHTIASSGAVILRRGMACTFCRRRKLRCSGERPTCEHCQRLDYVCVYMDKSDKKGSDYLGTPLSTSEPLCHPPIPLSVGPSPALSKSVSSSSSRRPSIQRQGSSSNAAHGTLPAQFLPTVTVGTEYDSPLSNVPLRQTQPYDNPQGTTNAPAPGISYGGPYSSNYISPQTPVHLPPHHPPAVPLSRPAPYPPTLPPGIQYPAEDETAWYQAALRIDPPVATQGGYIYHAQDAGSGDIYTSPQRPPAQGQYISGSHSTPTQRQYSQFDNWQSTPGAGPSNNPATTSYGQGQYHSGAEYTGTETPDQLEATLYPHSYQQVISPDNNTSFPLYDTSTPSVQAGYIPGIAHEGIYLSPDGIPIPLAPTSNSIHTTADTTFDRSRPQYTPNILGYSTPYHNQQSDGEEIDTRPQATRSASSNSYQGSAPSLSLPDGSLETMPSFPSSYYEAQGRAQTQEQSEATSTPASTTVSVSVREGEYYPQNMGVMYAETPESHIAAVESLSERLGEFFLGPSKTGANTGAGAGTEIGARSGQEGAREIQPEEESPRRRHKKARNTGSTVTQDVLESDGLTDSARNAMLDVFFQHHKMFLDLSIPRFKYRLTFHDRRRPSLALLNAMYMWATRMSHEENMANMESYFYQKSVIHLDASAATGDRLMDCIRAAYLLSAFQYMNGRHHSGYLLCGHASQLAKSCGLHQITSTVFSPAPPSNPLLRSKTYLLPPPDDALELGERIHTFWAIFSLDRSSSALTGFNSSFRDSDVTTPFPRELGDIASGVVTHRDDVSVRDLYRLSYQHPNERSYLRWVKAIIILERASKLAFLDPEPSSEHTRQWILYNSSSHPHLTITMDHPPPGYLEQPRYRVPAAFKETRLGLDMLLAACGEDGIFPLDQKRNATMDGREEVIIPPAVIIFHHIIAATQMLLYDTNSLDAENTEALIGARKSVALIRDLPALPLHAVDAFAPLTWVMVAKVLIKEMYRLRQLGDIGWKDVEEEIQCLIDEIYRAGTMMPPSRMYAKGVEELMRFGHSPQTAYPRDYFQSDIGPVQASVGGEAGNNIPTQTY